MNAASLAPEKISAGVEKTHFFAAQSAFFTTASYSA